MEKRLLGNTSVEIAPLVLGGNVFGWTIDEKTSFDVLDAFERFRPPDEFKAYETVAYAKGFLMVSASPLTRSSRHAGEDFARLKAARDARAR
jgi:hypothetical protein